MPRQPVEHAHLTAAALRGFVTSERLVLIGGIFTGPLFGWFGRRLAAAVLLIRFSTRFSHATHA